MRGRPCRHPILAALAVAGPAVVLSLAGCRAAETRNAASVVDFLYPNTKAPVVSEEIPVLSLPVRVGVAFVPSSRSGPHGSPGAQEPLTEDLRLALLETVAEHFEQRPFVESIQVIPGAYLRPGGSFENLEQLRGLFGVDLVALVSYDQIQFTDQSFLSLTYWTIVGAYTVPGDKNDTHTMLDTVVYDVASRKMLFRAPGTHHIEGRSTWANQSEELREDSQAGFDAASKAMIANLDRELDEFRERVRERPEEYKVVQRDGGTGGGSLDPLTLAAVAVLALGFGWRWLRP